MPMNDQGWLTVSQVAKYLQLSRAKVYDMAQKGEIPRVKVVGRWRFNRQEIDSWLRENSQVAEREGSK